jgi:type IV pilus assembly protein PilQ
MKSPNRKQVLYGIFIILVIPAILLITGCASHQKVETLSTAVPQNLVKKVAIEESDEGKRIIIEAEAPLPYTYFRIIPQPLKLVVDIPQTELAPEVTTTLPVDDEVIKEIVAIQHDEDVEVSIYLNKLVRYRFQKEGAFLYVDMGKESPLLAKEREEIEIVKETPPAVQEEEIAKPLAPAQNLVDVSVDTSHKDRVILSLKADGALGDYNTFDLQKPTRLVIDLWKVKRKFQKKAVSVNSPYLKDIRLGDHPQKVRVVLDFPTHVLPIHRIERVGDEVRVVLGKEVKAEDFLPAPKKEEIAREAEKEMIAEKGGKVTPTVITGIDFKQLEDKSRIVISTSAKALYEVEKGPENNVQIEIKGMEVPPKLSRPLDTHEFASPVSMITPINVAVGGLKSTQLIVKLRQMVAFDVTQENDRIYLDFERPEEFKFEKPKPLEVVTTEKTPAEQELAKTETEKAEIAPPTPATQVTPAVPSEKAMEKVYTGKKITLDFKDADIDNILRLFAEVSDLNIITTEDVKGTVTVRLVDVPWDQAFDIILQSKNLGVERIGNVMRIAPLARISAERKLRAEAAKSTEDLEPLLTELIQVSYSTATELAPKIKGLLSSRGTVTVDERTNTLIVNDIQANIISAKDLVRILDAQTPQVLIQAKVIEANLDFGRELGIQWGGSFESGTSTTAGDSPAGGDWAVNLPAAVGSGAGGAIEFAIANLTNTRYLQARISALETKGQGKIISSPRVTTLDHTEASIEQGLRIPYLKLTDQGTATTDFIEANLKLTVTPHVTADGHIKMELTISKDTPDQSITVQGVPSIDKKEVKTEVLVKDGEVVVIGGIYTYNKTGSIDAVPLFYKIPLLGWLFQKRTKDDTKRELLIFIAPRIVQPRRTTTS